MKEGTQSSGYRLKKLLKMLGAIRGRYTELVTVYIPVGYSMSEVAAQLRDEQGTADNIKSKSVRKNVTSALEKIMRHMQLYKKTPDNGLALFCGNISEKEGVADMELWAIEPPEPIRTKLYWCDQTFVLDPLAAMVEEKEVYGLVTLDKSDADLAILKGKHLDVLGHFESIVPGKTRAGGQSSARFSRVREGMLNDWLKEIGDAVNEAFGEHKELKGVLIGGPGPIKEIFMREDYVHADIKKKVLGTVDTSYTGVNGLHEIIERGQELIKEAAVVKERNLLAKFLEGLQKPDGLVAYGFAEVDRLLKAGTVDTVILSELVSLRYMEYECRCGTITKAVRDEDKNRQICPTCKFPMKILGEKEMLEYFEEETKNYGSKLEMVSAETKEGAQFDALGGIGAFLRYHS